jgi:hypothetical protein
VIQTKTTIPLANSHALAFVSENLTDWGNVFDPDEFLIETTMKIREFVGV